MTAIGTPLLSRCHLRSHGLPCPAYLNVDHFLGLLVCPLHGVVGKETIPRGTTGQSRKVRRT